MRLPLSVLLAFGLSAAAHAGTGPESPLSVTTTGFTKLENLSLKGQELTFLYSDMRSTVRYAASDDLGIGVDLGFNGLRVQDHLGDAIYAAAFVDGPYGKLSFGGPQLVMPDVFDTPAIAGSELTELVAGLFSGDIVRDLNLLPEAPALRGLRYDATFGPLTLAAALHEFSATRAPLRQIAVTLDGGAWTASAGMAQIDTARVHCHQYKAALTFHKGAFSGGISATHQHFNRYQETDFETYGTLRVTPHLSISAKRIDLLAQGWPTHAWGVTTTYLTSKGYFAEAGLARIDRWPGALVNIAVGTTF